MISVHGSHEGAAENASLASPVGSARFLIPRDWPVYSLIIIPQGFH